MQQQAHQSRKQLNPQTEDSPHDGLPPVKTFLVLTLLLVAVLAAAVATRPRAESLPAATSPAPPILTLNNVEAIARFEQLHRLFREASRKRDISLLSKMLTRDSKLHNYAAREIRQLKQDNVLDRSSVRTTAIRVTENTPDEIKIDQVVIVRPRFVDDATYVRVPTSGPVRQLVKWTLRLEGSDWKVHDVLVVRSERIEI